MDPLSGNARYAHLHQRGISSHAFQRPRSLSGLFFEIGAGKLVLEENSTLVLETGRKRIEATQKRRHEDVLNDIRQDDAHSHMQSLRIKLGKALGFDVLVAADDRGRSFRDDKFSFQCLGCLPELGVPSDVAATIDLIDVLWFKKGTSQVACDVSGSTGRSRERGSR